MKCKVCGEAEVITHIFVCAKDHKYIEHEGQAIELADSRKEPPRINIPPKVERDREDREFAETEHRRQTTMMPFGKYGPKQGDHRMIEDLPTDYIEWCLENMDNLSKFLRTKMEEQMQLREGRGVPR